MIVIGAFVICIATAFVVGFCTGKVKKKKN